jgi:pantetheine-phosphate adenylyltransferase
MSKALYPGSFDPITNGHLDVIERASKIFETLEVVIMNNPTKKTTFTVEERLEMLNRVISRFPNVTCSAQEGLTVDYAKRVGADVLVRGIRAVMDIETVFLLTRPKYSFLSSSVVKQIALNKGELHLFVPDEIKDIILRKYETTPENPI